MSLSKTLSLTARAAGRKALVAALAASALVSITASAEQPIPDEYRINGWAIGCQAYTFNRFTAFEAIEKTAQAGGKVIEFFPGQRLSKEHGELKVSHDGPSIDEVSSLLKEKLAKHGIRAVNYGVVGIPNNEAQARKVFDFARKLGLRAVTTESADSVVLIEKLAVEYDVAVAFHNHPGDMANPNYKVWSPHYIAGLVEGRSKLLGACADTGHWARSGIKPVEALRVLKGRIVSSHLKDLNEFGKRGAHDMPFGTGVCSIAEILAELKAQGFQGNLSVEYEFNWDHSVPEVTQCIDFVRNFGKK